MESRRAQTVFCSGGFPGVAVYHDISDVAAGFQPAVWSGFQPDSGHQAPHAKPKLGGRDAAGHGRQDACRYAQVSLLPTPGSVVFPASPPLAQRGQEVCGLPAGGAAIVRPACVPQADEAAPTSALPGRRLADEPRPPGHPMPRL